MSYIFELIVLVVELRGVWATNAYTGRILHDEHLIIEGDSAIVVTWIQEAMRRESMHPFLYDITALLLGCTDIIVWHVYWKANSATNCITFYVVEHSRDILWTDLGDAPRQLRDIFLSIFLDIFILDFYSLNTPCYQKKEKSSANLLWKAVHVNSGS